MTTSVAPTLSIESEFERTPLVLIVDDHAPTLEGLKALVEQSGYSCVVATSAVEALIYCDQNRPALVITDFSMPRLNGDCLARWLKPRFPTTPMLMITGDSLHPDVVESLSEYFVEIIPKPLDVEPFVVLLDSLLKM